jgi:L-lactate dehydrogenase (cytochrome)
MAKEFNTNYPSIDDLRMKAQKNIPKFAFEYLDGGCNEDVNLHRNISELREVQLRPQYIKNFNGYSIKTKLLGIEYDAPFGIAPIGLQGLIWPNSPEILAKAAFKYNIPFVLSTVTTSSIERVSELTEGKAWFQLYHPTENSLRDDIIKRAAAAECPVLVILCDVPSFGFRPRDIRNGLAMPPKMSVRNILQVMGKPTWAINTLRYGQPNFANLKPYMPKGLDLKQLGQFMDATFSGRLNEDKIKEIRDQWKGKLVLKGVASEVDAKEAIRLGIDGIIVSNHGGRQLDSGESSIKPLTRIAEKFGNQIEVMMDSGIRSGSDVARAIASGTKFTFMGRSFMYGAAALGNNGGNHTISLLKKELNQIMEQLCCEKLEDLPSHLIKK